MGYNIRQASREELDIIIDWAAKEGWNPGLYDADAFYKTDPSGYFIGFLDNEPVSSISAVAYDSSFGFLGFYIVKPEHRGKGYGLKIWKEALKHLPTQNVGLDGVVEQQDNYKKSGFKLAYKNIRYEGFGLNKPVEEDVLVDLQQIAFDDLLDYDSKIFPTRREVFLKDWISQPESLAVGYKNNEQLIAYGMIRKCRKGYRIGPLFSDSNEVAELIFEKLRDFAGKDNFVYFDVPEVNISAVKLVEKNQFKPVFETARMYSIEKPDVPMQKIYGVTTFELG